MVYEVDVVHTKSKSARYKACIGMTNCGHGELTTRVRIEADSDAAAYRKICGLVLPGDSRLVGRKKYLAYFRRGGSV